MIFATSLRYTFLKYMAADTSVYVSAPGPGSRGYAPMGADGWDCSLLNAVYQMLSLFFPVQPQSTELPATTEERWRRRHLSPGHKAGMVTVLLTCTLCVCVSSRIWSYQECDISKGRPSQELADTTPRTGQAPACFNLHLGWRVGGQFDDFDGGLSALCGIHFLLCFPSFCIGFLSACVHVLLTSLRRRSFPDVHSQTRALSGAPLVFQ